LGSFQYGGTALDFDTIHVGLAALDRSVEGLRSLESHLTDDERQRAARFHFDRDRMRFVCARGLLRHLLTAELDLPPDRIRFVYGAHGKPSLAPDQARSGLRFNVSHSDGLGLFVLARERAIGADIEKIRPVRYGRAVASRFFAADECAALEGLVGDDFDRAFFRCWTRKEAFVKAVGDGLSYPLRSFSVAVSERDPARILRVDGDPSARERFWLTTFPAGTGFEAAIVTEGGPCTLSPLLVEAPVVEAPR
jgi:4'-phosphopantetheinyl transferase